MPLIVSDLNFSQRANGACYQAGSNKLSVEMYNQESEVWEALLLFAVNNADTGALLAINAKRGFNPIGTTSCDVRFEIPDDVDIAQTRATLLLLDADTDGNGQVDLINVYRTDHAAVVGIDGTNVQTANMGSLDLSQTILTGKTGAAVPLSQLRPGDVLAITWHPGKFRTPYQAIVLPASYVDGTITEQAMSYCSLSIDDVSYDCFIPNSSYPYQFPLSVAMEGRFYLDRYGDIFAVSVQDSFQPYDWLQSVQWEEFYHKELILQTSGHGTYWISETDALQLQDNTGKITAVTPMDLLSADDFSGTTFAPLFDGQETLPVYQLLLNLPTLTEAATADDLFTHAVGAAYDYTTNRLTLSPLPMSEKTALPDVVFTKADMTLAGDASYPLAPDALLLQAVVQSNQVRVRQATAEQIPDGAYDMLLYGKDASNRYRAAIFIRATQWLQAQPAIVEQVSQTTGDTLTGSVYTQSGRKEIAFASSSGNADNHPAAGDVILYLPSGDTVRQFLTLGKADASNPLQFAPTDILSSTGLGIRCIYGYAVANDGETLTIVSGTENIPVAVPADFTVTHADYTALPQNGLTVSPTTIASVISLNATMSSETPSATPVMACLRNGALIDLIAFSPVQTFTYDWETSPMSIVTRVSETLDQSGNPVIDVSAVQNNASREVVYHLSGSSINADTGKAAAMTEDFCQGDVVLFYADLAGNVLQYRIVGTIIKNGNTPFALKPAFEAEDNGIPHDQYRLGYIQGIGGSTIDIYYPNATQWQEERYRLYGANEYCYNDSDAQNIRIEVDDYYGINVDEPYDGKCSYVLVHLRNGEIVDIYSFNKRYPIPKA